MALARPIWCYNSRSGAVAASGLESILLHAESTKAKSHLHSPPPTLTGSELQEPSMDELRRRSNLRDDNGVKTSAHGQRANFYRKRIPTSPVHGSPRRAPWISAVVLAVVVRNQRPAGAFEAVRQRARERAWWSVDTQLTGWTRSLRQECASHLTTACGLGFDSQAAGCWFWISCLLVSTLAVVLVGAHRSSSSGSEWTETEAACPV